MICGIAWIQLEEAQNCDIEHETSELRIFVYFGYFIFTLIKSL